MVVHPKPSLDDLLYQRVEFQNDRKNVLLRSAERKTQC